jgi:hypothetical protein
MEVLAMKTEDVNWEFCRAVTEDMLSRLLPPGEDNITDLNGQNGVYIIACESNSLSFGLRAAEEPQVVFVGLSKANSSRHFTSGFTGTSTMRRSLAALLQNSLGLIPVPRSNDESDNDRYDNYALDASSEEKLTRWMFDNFKFAFYECDASIVPKLHAALLDYNVPLFNFQNNPHNKYGAEIKKYRKICANAARNNALR